MLRLLITERLVNSNGGVQGVFWRKHCDQKENKEAVEPFMSVWKFAGWLTGTVPGHV